MKKISKEGKISRREFLTTTSAIGLATVIPRSVLGRGFVPPSDKINLVHIGCGSEGLNEVGALLRCPQIEIVGVADPNLESYDYIYWSRNGLRDSLRRLIDEPSWLEGIKGHPGGRNIMKYVVETYYKKNRQGWKGSIPVAEDYREMLDRMRDVDSVKIMTPDHLHAYVAVDCFRRGKHQIMHKPLGNKLTEGMKVVDVASSSSQATHMMAFNSSSISGINQVKAWIDAGAIGKLKEIHNWTNRPVWPQYPDIPTEKPPIPDGFNWDLWLGPAQMRDYSPKYTFCTFRGWYEFGAGSIADMGYYSMIPVFNALGLGSAISASTRFSRVVRCNEYQVPSQVVNTWSYPDAAAYCFELPYKDGTGSVLFNWHDGGMKPQKPEGYDKDDLPISGMMFTGEKGTIIGDFNAGKPELIIPGETADKYADVKANPMPAMNEMISEGTPRWLHDWIENVKTGKKNPCSYEFTREITETFNLGAVSLQCNGKKLLYNPTVRRITNDDDANRLLERDTRKGWEFV